MAGNEHDDRVIEARAKQTLGLVTVLGILIIVVLGLGLVPWLFNLAGSGSRPVFVVVEDGAALRSQPAEAGAVIGRLMPGSQADRIDSLPGWVRVEQAGGSRGWVGADEVVALTFPYE